MALGLVDPGLVFPTLCERSICMFSSVIPSFCSKGCKWVHQYFRFHFKWCYGIASYHALTLLEGQWRNYSAWYFVPQVHLICASFLVRPSLVCFLLLIHAYLRDCLTSFNSCSMDLMRSSMISSFSSFVMTSNIFSTFTNFPIPFLLSSSLFLFVLFCPLSWMVLLGVFVGEFLVCALRLEVCDLVAILPANIPVFNKIK